MPYDRAGEKCEPDSITIEVERRSAVAPPRASLRQYVCIAPLAGSKTRSWKRETFCFNDQSSYFRDLEKARRSRLGGNCRSESWLDSKFVTPKARRVGSRIPASCDKCARPLRFSEIRCSAHIAIMTDGLANLLACLLGNRRASRA